MLDRNFIRDNLDSIRERLSHKGFEFDVSGFETLDKREKSFRIENEELPQIRVLPTTQRQGRTETPESAQTGLFLRADQQGKLSLQTACLMGRAALEERIPQANLRSGLS